MNKIYLKSSAIIFFMLLLGSCNNDFLERYPLDQLSSETYWNNETELMNYNNGLYDLIRDDENYPILMGLGQGAGVRYYGGIWWQDEMSDNLAPTHERAQEFYKIRFCKQVVQTNPRPTGWTGWNLIRNINFGLANYDRAQVTDVVKNKYKAEARLFRGWFYAEKVSKFGDVQWVDKVLNIDDEDILYGKRDNRVFVMDKVMEDLDFAVANLPVSWNDGQNPSRVNKWVALAVKSRICLFEGTWRHYHGLPDAAKWLNACVAASKELMDNGGFRLFTTGKPESDYRHHLWQQSQVGNPEVIYWRKYEEGNNSHFASRLFLNYNGGATKDFVEDILCNDGLPINLSDKYAGDAVIEDVFVNRDPRLRQCVLHPADKVALMYPNDTRTYPRITGMSGGGNTSTTGYHVIKHWNAADEIMPRDFHTASPPALRLAEIYLNYAEAKAVLGTISQADLDATINKLRDRVAMPHLTMNPPMDPRYANDGVSALMVEIRRERRVELFLEGHRYNDIRRWKQGKKFEKSDYGILWDDVAKKRFPSAQVKTAMINGKPYIDVRASWTAFYANPVWEDKMYLWPLPLSAISQNPELGQNPGWE
jgi:starch-binding outer membrane protein, SusD/RagB family